MDTVRRRYETTRWVGLQNVRVLQARNGPRRRPAAPALLQGRFKAGRSRNDRDCSMRPCDGTNDLRLIGDLNLFYHPGDTGCDQIYL